MTTDLHAHFLPAELAEALAMRQEVPRITETELAMPIGTVHFGDGAIYCSLADRIARLDAAGIDRQLLSLPGLFGIDSLPRDQSHLLCALFNAGAAAAAAAYPHRFAWLAALPLADSTDSATVLAEALGDGAKGAILPCTAFTSLDLAKSRAAPLFAALQATGGGHAFVHPGRWPGEAPPPATPYPDLAFARRQVHIQSEITEAAITLLFSPFLDRYPDVTVQIANLGGMLAMVAERIDEVVVGRGLDAAPMSLKNGRVWLDCASMGPRAIEIAVGVFGADAVVLGTDMPIFGAPERMAAVAAADLTADARAHLLDAGAALWP